MNKKDILLLESNGWELECISPFEIRHLDGSFATLNAAKTVLNNLKLEKDLKKLLKKYGI